MNGTEAGIITPRRKCFERFATLITKRTMQAPPNECGMFVGEPRSTPAFNANNNDRMLLCEKHVIKIAE